MSLVTIDAWSGITQEQARALPESVCGVRLRSLILTVGVEDQTHPVGEPLRVVQEVVPVAGAGLQRTVADAVRADGTHLCGSGVHVRDLGTVRAAGQLRARDPSGASEPRASGKVAN